MHSITEGENGSLKCPVTFGSVELLRLKKIDLMPYLEADVGDCIANVRDVNPTATILPTGTGAAMPTWFG